MSSTWIDGITEPRRRQGWIDYVDSQYTSASPLSLPAGVRTQVTIDGLAARSDDTYREDIRYEPWDGSRFRGETLGETFLLRFGFTARLVEDMFSDIVGSTLTDLLGLLTSGALADAFKRQNVIRMEYDFQFFTAVENVATPRRENDSGEVTRLTRFHSGPLVISPGAEIYLTSTYDTEVFDFDLSIDRTFVP